jgi:maltodextrin utilization protein YvdJ
MLDAVTCLSNTASKYYSNNFQYKSVLPIPRVLCRKIRNFNYFILFLIILFCSNILLHILALVYASLGDLKRSMNKNVWKTLGSLKEHQKM